MFDEAPTNRPIVDPFFPGEGGRVSMMCCCGIGDDDGNERKWEALRTI